MCCNAAATADTQGNSCSSAAPIAPDNHAATDAAHGTGAAIHGVALLKVAGLADGVGKVAQGAATCGFDGAGQYRLIAASHAVAVGKAEVWAGRGLDLKPKTTVDLA